MNPFKKLPEWLQLFIKVWLIVAVITFVATLLGANASWITNPFGSLKQKFLPPKAPATTA